MSALFVVLLTALLSALLCAAYLSFARKRNLFATPNERSSHTEPTPHGGGLPLFLAFFSGLALTAAAGTGWPPALLAMSLAAALLLTLGVLDDQRGLSMRLRLGAYALVTLPVAGYLLNGALSAQPLVAVLLVSAASLALLWLLNLYNFMDGIDGLAGLQAIIACTGIAWLTRDGSHGGAYATYCLLLAAAHAGFLAWNWPPAKLFMGDAGSVPTGFLLGCLALFGYVQELVDPRCWLILLAVFIVDASWTLVWRMATGQAFTQAHRLHAYQRLSRHWGSHRSVDLLLLAIALLWLLPLASATAKWPQHGVFLVILAYLPLLLGMAKIRGLK